MNHRVALARYSPRLFHAAVAALLLLPAAGRAQALTDPPATASVLCATPAGYFNDSFACSVSGVTATVTLPGLPRVEAHAEQDVVGVDQNYMATASLRYYFEVVGGPPGVAVPIRVDAQLYTDPSQLGRSAADIEWQVDNVIQQLFACNTAGCSSSLSGTLSSFMLPDAPSSITLNATAGVGIDFGFESATAWADPRIYVDPSFPDAALYRIVLSDGVGNGTAVVSPVPEPETAALLVAGMMAVAARVRRRRRPAHASLGAWIRSSPLLPAPSPRAMPSAR